MGQKCSYLKVLEVFFVEPTTLHFIKEISKKIGIAPTSVRNHIKDLLDKDLIKKKKARPFDGFIANRENEDFIFYKKVYNLYSLKELTEFLISSLWPKLIVVFGSYARGEDIEESDIDILIISKTKKEINLKKFEKKLKRKINLLIIDKLEKLDKNLIKKIYNGIVLYGSF
ncbi:hypothetical protein B6U82_00310 [Candidatus Pacearchaeota archaeon ex4484_31]|nr:MAG: hypothetical protein B6U82_00310 [Candidatus Pacearchaeota archaeon ex4484_31]